MVPRFQRKRYAAHRCNSAITENGGNDANIGNSSYCGDHNGRNSGKGRKGRKAYFENNQELLSCKYK